MNKSRRAKLTAITVLAIIVATVIISLGSNLWGSTYLIRSDTVFNHAPWSETVPTDFEITPITGTDPVDSGFPAHVQFFGRANEGDLAQWNPYPSGGVPLGSVPNTGPFDPLNLPFLFLADEHAPTAGKLLELALAVGGMVLFLRRLHIGYAVALVGGLIYAFNGFQTFWTNWPQSHIGALIPWMFWAAEGLIATRQQRHAKNTARYAGAVAVITAVMLLAGFPAVTFFVLGALAVYVVARSLAIHKTSSRTKISTKALRIGLNLTVICALAILGAGLAAWQLAPFSAQIETVDTEYRHQTSQDRLPVAALLTTAVPNVIGSYDLDRTESKHNYFETQSFIGAGALVLVAVALVRRRPRSLPRWLIPTLALMTTGVVMLIYFGGPLLVLAQQLPVIGSNRIGRLRAVFLFLLSVLAAIGLASVVQNPRGKNGWATWINKLRARLRDSDRHRWRFAALSTVTVLGIFAITVVAFWHFSADERNHDHGGAVGRAALLAVVAASVVAIVTLLARKHKFIRYSAPAVVALIAAVEILVLAVPWWPNTDPQLHYPTTAAHEFLFDNGADDRIATHDLTMYSGTTGYYGLRTVSGHSFHWPTWRDMLLAVDPLAEDWNDTFTVLDFVDQQRMQSPILDRLAVRWIVNPLHIPPAGVSAQLTNETPITAGAAPISDVRVPVGESLSLTVPSEPLRGVSFYLSEDLLTNDTSAYMRVDVTTSDGQVITSKRRLAGALGVGWPWLPVAGEDIAPGGEMTIAVSLEADDGVFSLGTSQQGELALFVMRPGNNTNNNADNMRLAHVSGAAIWENLDALKRVRFAPLAMSITNPAQRLEVLSQPVGSPGGLPGEIVVLSDPLPRPNTQRVSTGQVLSVADTFDTLQIEVRSDGPGYVVVADAMQHGWNATVNAESVEVLDADHAVVAVAVPGGLSKIEFTYSPPRLSLGLTISALSVLVLLALFVGPLLARRKAS